MARTPNLDRCASRRRESAAHRTALAALVLATATATLPAGADVIHGNYVLGDFDTTTPPNASSVVQSGTSRTVTGDVTVAAPGAGSYTLIGGTLTASRINPGWTGQGTFNLNGGRTNAKWENIGWQDQGTFNQTGGVNSVGDIIYMGSFPSGNGTYNLEGGGQVVTGTAPGDEIRVGNGGTGTFNHTDGSVSTLDLHLGYYSTGLGDYTLTRGAVTAADDIRVGRSGTGTFVQSGAGTTVSVGDEITLGYNSSGDGEYHLDGGSVTVGDDVSVGTDGTGRFYQRPGTSLYVTDTLYLADDRSTSRGEFTFDRGTLSAFDEEIGDEGVGVFKHLDGTHTVRDDLALGQESTGDGTYTLTRGALNVADYLAVGQYGKGTLVQSAVAPGEQNEVTVGGTLYLGDDSATSSGTYTLGANASLTAAEAQIGDAGKGVFNHDGGTVSVAGTLYLGQESAGDGIYHLDGSGTVVAGNLDIGSAGKGTFNQYGADTTNTVRGTLTLNSDDDRYDLVDGTLTTRGALNQGTFSMEGGRVRRTADPGDFVNGTRGSMVLTGTRDKRLGATLRNHGAVTVRGGGSLVLEGVLDGSGEIFNEATGVLDLQQGSIRGSGGFMEITNRGTLRKTAAPGTDGSETASIDARLFSEGGTLETTAGTLRVTEGGVHQGTGRFVLANDATLEFATSGLKIAGAYTASGQGTVHLNGAGSLVDVEIDAAGGLTSSLTGGGLVIDANVQADGALTNAGKARWETGRVTGTAGLANTGTLTIRPTIGVFIDGTTLDNADTVLQQGVLALENGAVITNAATGRYVLAGAAEIGNAGRFVNRGRLDVTDGGNSIGAAFEHESGSVNLVSGDLELAGGGSSRGTGTVGIGAGRLLELGGGNFQYAGTYDFSGQGDLLVGAATFRADTGKVTVNQSGGGRLVVDSESAKVGATSKTTAQGEMINTGDVLWMAGKLGGGSASADSGGGTGGFTNRGALEIAPGGSKWVGGTLRNAGTVTQRSGTTVTARDVAVIDNGPGGTYVLEGTAVIDRLNYAATPFRRFENSGGTLRKTGAGESRIEVDLVHSGGLIEVLEGTLDMSGKGSVSGTAGFAVARNATLDLRSTSLRFEDSHLFSGKGEVKIGNVETVGRGTVAFGLDDGGKLWGNGVQINAEQGAVVNRSDADLSGFTILGAAGLRNEAAGSKALTFSTAAPIDAQLGGRLENSGLIRHQAGQHMELVTFLGHQAPELVNEGTYLLEGTLSVAKTADIQNTGTFKVNAAGATRSIKSDRGETVTFSNTGTVEVAARTTLTIDADVAQRGGLFGTSLTGGTWIVNDGGRIDLGAGGFDRIGADATVDLRGNGALGNLPAVAGSFVNDGALKLRRTTFRTGGRFDSNGRLEVDRGSVLFVNGQFESNAGSVNVIDGIVTATGDFDNDGGSFSGSGSLNASDFNNRAGAINPGHSPGLLTLAGNYNHFAGATLVAEIGGGIAGTGYDQLLVEGTATILGGVLDLVLYGDYRAPAGAFYDVLVADRIVGEAGAAGRVLGLFDRVDQPAAAGGRPLFGLSVVDLGAIGRQALRVTALDASTGAVPEPLSLVLALTGVGAVATCRRRRVPSRRPPEKA